MALLGLLSVAGHGAEQAATKQLHIVLHGLDSYSIFERDLLDINFAGLLVSLQR